MYLLYKYTHQYVCFLGWLAGAGLLGPLPSPLCTLAPLVYGFPALPDGLMLLCRLPGFCVDLGIALSFLC